MDQSPQTRAGCDDLPPSTAKVGGLEQANIPRRVECGGGAVMSDPGDNLWRDPVTWLSRIPEGTERSSEVLFERGF